LLKLTTAPIRGGFIVPSVLNLDLSGHQNKLHAPVADNKNKGHGLIRRLVGSQDRLRYFGKTRKKPSLLLGIEF
jgi:hypothetical protein